MTIATSRKDATSWPGDLRANPTSSFKCSASGALASRVFAPVGLRLNSAADGTAAIQAAIDKATSVGGGIVILPAGEIVIDGHIVLKSNVGLVGRGASTVLKAGPDFLGSTGPDGGYPMITTTGASNVTIAHLTADQSGDMLDADAHQGARLSAYLIDVQDSSNAVVDGVYTRNPFTYSIAVVGSSNFCVSHCDTQVAAGDHYYSLDGIHVLDSNTGRIIDNRVDQRLGPYGDDGLVAHTINAPVYDVLYAGNIVRGGSDGDGMQLAVGKYPISNIRIIDNDFWGSPFGIRTGYWGTDVNGSVHDITIEGNYIHGLVPGFAFPDGGDAINIGGFGAVGPVTDIKVENNYVCAAGRIIVASGAGNVTVRNAFCSG